MTRFTVGWRNKAIQQLAHIWNEAPDRIAVTRTSDLVDSDLAVDADHKGTDYFGDRVVTLDPLWALFRGHPEDRRVEVLEIGRPGIDLPHDE